ncbi:MAG: TetR/AcrR family transcriptional regulator [Candidatus Neomarinimicrobiota bacterium]
MNLTRKPNSESPKFKQIVEIATELFRKYGVKRVTIEEICTTAQISKMTFYKYFANKIDLAEYIIFNILDNAQLEFDNIFNQSSSFAEKIDQFIQMKLKYAKQFSKEFYFDFMNLSPKIHQKIIAHSQKNRTQYIQLIKQAQKIGDIRKDISLKFISYMLNNIFELREDEELLSLYNDLEEMTLDIITFYFFGIMGKK